MNKMQWIAATDGDWSDPANWGGAAGLAANDRFLSADAGYDPGTSDFAVTIFCELASLADYYTLIATGATYAGDGGGFHLFVNASGALYLYVEDAIAGLSAGTLAVGLSAGARYCITVNFDRNGNASCRINGADQLAVDITSQSAGLGNSIGAVHLGGFVAGLCYTLDGSIGPVVIHNRLLTDAEHDWLYHVGAARKYEEFGAPGDGSQMLAGLVHYLQLGYRDPATGMRYDKHGTNHVLELGGPASIVPGPSGAAPGVLDEAVFDSSSTQNCTLTGAIAPGAITAASGYTGSLSGNGYDVTVGDASLAGGTWTPGPGATWTIRNDFSDGGAAVFGSDADLALIGTADEDVDFLDAGWARIEIDKSAGTVTAGSDSDCGQWIGTSGAFEPAGHDVTATGAIRFAAGFEFGTAAADSLGGVALTCDTFAADSQALSHATAAWHLTAATSATCGGAGSVAWCDASAGVEVEASAGPWTDGGHNLNWRFVPLVLCVTAGQTAIAGAETGDGAIAGQTAHAGAETGCVHA